MTDKTCSKCGEPQKTHPVAKQSDYYRSPHTRDGFRGDCKGCCGEQNRRYRAGKKVGHSARGRGHSLDKMAYCESEMGKRKMFTGNYVRFWKDGIKGGIWPPGSIWVFEGKREIVWGPIGEPQYTVELKRR